MGLRGAGATREPSFYLRLLGPPEVRSLDGAPVPIIPNLGLGLLAYLTLSSRPRTRDHLAMLLWSGKAPAKRLHSLRQLLYCLNRALPKALSVRRRFVYADPTVMWVDVSTFELEIQRGELSSAMRLWDGPFMDGWGGDVSWDLEEWVERKGLELERLLRSPVAEAGRIHLAAGRPEEAAALLGAACSMLPEKEDLRLLRIQALTAMGRHPEAEAAAMGSEFAWRGPCIPPPRSRIPTGTWPAGRSLTSLSVGPEEPPRARP